MRSGEPALGAWAGCWPRWPRALRSPSSSRVRWAGRTWADAPRAPDPLGLVAAEWGRGPQARIPELTVATVHQAVTNAALTLRNARLLDEVRRLATRDELTGLANRRLFEETLALSSANAKTRSRNRNKASSRVKAAYSFSSSVLDKQKGAPPDLSGRGYPRCPYNTGRGHISGEGLCGPGVVLCEHCDVGGELSLVDGYHDPGS